MATLLPVSARLLLSQDPIEADVILRAMRDELERSRQLRVVGGAGDSLPYFISYTVGDADNLSIGAELGSVFHVNRRRFRSPIVEVRVGDYDFDNTGHVFSGLYSGSRYDAQPWPLDDNYSVIRQDLWLATDHAYKAAIESMSRKRAALNSVTAPADRLPDFSKTEPVTSLAKVTPVKLDEAGWTSRVMKLSAVFQAYPEVLASGVEFLADEGVTYMMTSEGSAIRYRDSMAILYAKVEAQAADGMILHEGISFSSLEPERFPSDAEIRKSFIEMAEDVRALSHAPAGEAFSGPVLFEPRAAAQLFAQLLGENLGVPRKPLTDPGRQVNFVSSEFETKIGSRILPDWMDVVDDATQTSWQNQPLVGYYPFDLEGVKPRAVSVVEKGVLKGFLTTRQPGKNSPFSNGHARLPGGYGTRAAGISNLFVKASETATMADLKKKLIDMCQQRGKPYGMLVRKLDYPFSADTPEVRAMASSSAQSGGSVRPVSLPVLLYRVYADGREELVRGLRFRGVSTRSLRDIVAASRETALFDYVASGSVAMLNPSGFLAPSAVIAPGMLFEEIEFELPQDQLPKPPVVPPPPETGGAAA